MADAQSSSTPPLIDAATLANLLNLTPRRLQQMVNEGIIPKPYRRGQYLFAESIKGYTAYQQALLNNRDPKNIAAEVREEQLRKLKIENDQVEGGLIPIDEVSAVIDTAAATLARMFDSLSGRLTPQITPLLRDDVPSSTVKGLIDDEQQRIRSEVADSLEEAAPASALRTRRQAKGSKASRRVGGRRAASA